MSYTFRDCHRSSPDTCAAARMSPVWVGVTLHHGELASRHPERTRSTSSPFICDPLESPVAARDRSCITPAEFITDPGERPGTSEGPGTAGCVSATPGDRLVRAPRRRTLHVFTGRPVSAPA